MNFLALLGWAPDGETTIMSRDELVERFSLERVGSSPSTFDYAKLDWMNGVYLRALPAEEYADRLVSFLRDQGSEWPEDRIRAAAPLVQEKIGSFGEFADFAGFLFHDVEPGSGPPRRAHSRRCRNGAREAGELDRRGDRVGVEEALRRAGGEASDRLPADTRRGHGLTRVAGPVREPGAPREGHRARAARPVGELPRRPGRRRARTDELDRRSARAHRPVRGGDRRSAVDSCRPGASRRRSVRERPSRTGSSRSPSAYRCSTSCFPRRGGMVVNYGVNKVRFPAPVPSGGRVRGRFRVLSIEESTVRGARDDRGEGRVLWRREAGLRSRARGLDSVLTSSGGCRTRLLVWAAA